MDNLEAEFDQVLEGMEWEEVVSTLQVAIHDMLAETPNPPSPPPSPTPPPSPVPTGPEYNTLFQPVGCRDGAHGDHILLGAAPRMMTAPNMNHGLLCQGDFMPPGHLRSQHAYSQGQYLPYQWPIEVPTAAAISHPAGPQHLYSNVQVMRFPNGINQNQLPGGVLNRELLYEVPADVFASHVFTAPPMNNTSNSNGKRQQVSQQAEERPYIKKPPNAFMLYIKEQRPTVAPEISSRGSAAVNAHLGEKWKSLTKEEQAKYFDQADKKRRLHEQHYPEWSTNDNYGKKRKRQRRKAPTRAKEITQQAKKQCVTQTAVMEASISHAREMGAPHAKTALMLQ